MHVHEVRKYQQEIDFDKSIGPDETSPRILKRMLCKVKKSNSMFI